MDREKFITTLCSLVLQFVEKQARARLFLNSSTKVLELEELKARLAFNPDIGNRDLKQFERTLNALFDFDWNSFCDFLNTKKLELAKELAKLEELYNANNRKIAYCSEQIRKNEYLYMQEYNSCISTGTNYCVLNEIEQSKIVSIMRNTAMLQTEWQNICSMLNSLNVLYAWCQQYVCTFDCFLTFHQKTHKYNCFLNLSVTI